MMTGNHPSPLLTGNKSFLGLFYNQAIHLGFTGLTASSTCAGSVVQLPL